MDDAHRSPWIHSVTRGVFQPSISFHVAAVEKGPQRPKKWDGASFGFQASLASHGSGSFLTLPSPSRLFRNRLSDPTIPRAGTSHQERSGSLLRAGCASKSAALSGLRWARRGVTQAADAREAERHLRHGKVQFQKACSPEACDGVERQKGLARRRDADRHSPPVRNELRRRTWQAAGCTLAVRTFRSPAVCQSASLPVC